MNCKTIHFGYTVYECQHCNNYSICGNKYLQDRMMNSKSKLLNAKHRHIVFTITKLFRNIFLEDRTL